MVRRSARVKSKQLKLECEPDTVEGSKDDLPSVTEDVAPQVVPPGNEANANTQEKENQEASSSFNSPFKIPSSARERALQNPYILQHLFKLCPALTVASCRLVCKQLYEDSLATWRTSFPVRIFQENGDLVIGRNRSLSRRYTPLKDFIEFNEDPENQCGTKPYRSVLLYECRYWLNLGGFKEFWKALGNNLTTLNLTNCSFLELEEFRQVIYICCPVLQKLLIDECTVSPSYSKEGEDNELEYKDPIYGEHRHLKSLQIRQLETKFPVSWVELFSHFPLLTSASFLSLTMRFGQVSHLAEVESVMDAIRIIRDTDKRKLPFTQFEVQPRLIISREPVSHRIFSLVKELRLPLTDCSIHVHAELDQHFLRDSLIPLVRTIELVHGKGDRGEDLVSIPTWLRDFPFEIQFNNLTKFISGADIVGNLNFLKFTPNLSELHIFDSQSYWYMEGAVRRGSTTEIISNTCKEALANLKMLRLTTFKLGFLVSDTELQLLFNWMPNIMDLGMILNDKQFGMVCENWKKLRRLTLLEDEMPTVTEEGVTDLEKVKMAREAGSFDIRPKISNLKYLEYLDLRYFRYENFSLESRFHLFIHLPNLQLLKLGHRSFAYLRSTIASYQRALQGRGNRMEQWLAKNLGKECETDKRKDADILF